MLNLNEVIVLALKMPEWFWYAYFKEDHISNNNKSII